MVAKSCPFCGETERIYPSMYIPGKTAAICMKCGAAGPAVDHRPGPATAKGIKARGKKALKKWDNRV